MQPNIYLMVIGSLLILVWLVIISRILVSDIYKKKLMISKDLEKLFSELDMLIINEFNFAITIPYSTLEFKLITDMKQTIDFIAKRVADATTSEYTDFFIQHGITKQYMYNYIIRRITSILIEYMAKNNMKSQTNDK